MTNMNSMASILQSLSDQQLQSEMKQPTAGVPQFLLLSEMQRRQQMRAEAASPKPVSPTPVAQEIMAANAPPPEQGGIAAFAAGGGVYAGTSDEAGERYNRYVRQQQSDLGQRIRNQFVNSFGFPQPPDAQAADDRAIGARYLDAIKDGAQRTGAAAMDVLTLPGRAAGGVANTAIRGVRALGADVPYIPEAFFGGDSTSMTPYYDRLRRADPPKPVKDNAASPDQYAGPQDMPMPAELPAPATASKNAGKASSRVSLGLGSLGGGSGGAAPAAPRGAEYTSMTPPERIADPEVASPLKYLEMVSQHNPDVTGEALARTDQRLAENQQGKKDALNHALIAAGLGMMSSKNRSFLGGAGEGGLLGLRQYTDAIKDVAKTDAELQRHRDNLLMAQAEAKRGNFKTAADLANQETSRLLTLHGQNVQERRADMQMQQADNQVRFQGKKLDEQMALEREKMGQAERLQRQSLNARMAIAQTRADAKGEGGTDKGAAAAQKAAIGEFNKQLSHYRQLYKGDALASPEEIDRKARAAAFAALTPQAQAMVNTMYSMGVASMPQQAPVLKLGKNGFYE